MLQNVDDVLSGPVNIERSTPTRILEAATLALTRRGADKLTMSDVSASAGVSRPTLYRYFPTKQALLLALALHEQERFDAGLRAAVESAPSPDEQLERATEYLVDFLHENRARQLIDVEPLFVLDRLRTSLPVQTAAITELLGDALARTPPVRRGDATPHDLAEMIARIAMSHFLLPHPDPEALLRTLRSLLGTPRRTR
jgi:AcrR family transcriptional regulator